MLVQFKKSLLNAESIVGTIIEAHDGLLAYLVNERRVRVFEMNTGKKCAINLDDYGGSSIASLRWGSNSDKPLLAILSKDSEVILTSIVSNHGSDELKVDTVSVLSFPEIGLAKDFSWSVNSSLSSLAVWGQSQEVFFVIVGANGVRTSFVSTKIKDIQEVKIINDFCFVCGHNMVESFTFGSSGYESCAFFVLENSESIDNVCALPMRDGRILLTAVSSIDDMIWFSEIRSTELIQLSSLKINHGSEYRRFRMKFDSETSTLLTFVPGEGITLVNLINLDQVHQPRFLELPAFDVDSSEPFDPIMDVFINEAGTANVVEETVDLCLIIYSGSAIRKHHVSCHISEIILAETATSISEDGESVVSLLDAAEVAGDERPASLPMSDSPIHLNSATGMSPAVIDLVRISIQREIRAAFADSIKTVMGDVIHEAISNAVEAAFKQISSDLMSLTRELISNAQASGSVITGQVSTSCDSAKVVDYMKESLALIASGKSGQALCRIVELGDKSQILKVCRLIEDPFSALDDSGYTVPFEALLAIFYALAVDIQDETQLKLDWMQELLIQIDLDDQSIIRKGTEFMATVNKVFSDLKALIREEGSSVDNIPLQKQAKTVMRLLRKFQMS